MVDSQLIQNRDTVRGEKKPKIQPSGFSAVIGRPGSEMQPTRFSAVIGRPGSDEPGRPITAQNREGWHFGFLLPLSVSLAGAFEPSLFITY